MREKKSKGLVSVPSLFSRDRLHHIGLIPRYGVDSPLLIYRLPTGSTFEEESGERRSRPVFYIYHAECHRWNGTDRIKRRSKSEEPALFFFFSVRFVISRNGRIDESVLTRSVQMVHGCIEKSVEEQGGKYMYHNMDLSLS
jgi:hypothetical protein